MKKKYLIIIYITLVFLHYTHLILPEINNFSDISLSLYLDGMIIVSMILMFFLTCIINVAYKGIKELYKSKDKKKIILAIIVFMIALLLKISEYVARAR